MVTRCKRRANLYQTDLGRTPQEVPDLEKRAGHLLNEEATAAEMLKLHLKPEDETRSDQLGPRRSPLAASSACQSGSGQFVGRLWEGFLREGWGRVGSMTGQVSGAPPPPVHSPSATQPWTSGSSV